MSREEPPKPAYKPMTQWAIIPGLVLALTLAVLALATPIGAWFGVLMPVGRAAPDWFMRSGAVPRCSHLPHRSKRRTLLSDFRREALALQKSTTFA